jgi:hypothetical protein
MGRINPHYLKAFGPAKFGEKLGREDASNNIVQSDLLSHAAQFAQNNGITDPEEIANFAIEYQQAYVEAHKQGKRG